MNVREVEDTHEMDGYPRRDVVLVRGEGCTVFDEQGTAYLDCTSNVGVSLLGYGNEKVARALHEQYLTLPSCYGIFYNDVRARLAQKLTDITPPGLSRVFFCNSGTEAVEAALRFARHTTQNPEIICAMRGFHGKTLGALGATWSMDHKTCCDPVLSGYLHVPFNNFEKVREAVTPKTAAILLEVIQGEGGVRVGDPLFFKKVRALCDSQGIILIIDEVQTGFGRTGTMFGCEQYVTPDILCLAKGIAGGVPMGAVICKDFLHMKKNSHTSTFGGNPLACAAALASIRIIEDSGLVRQSAERGAYLLEQLSTLDSPLIREVRGRGLMVGMELREKAGPYVQTLMEKGILVLLAGKYVIRLLPPLIITRGEIDRVVTTIEEVLQS
ncbi:MAG: aminotransferase class III-fold pyridoxal phosphate-dependent enzyme [Theionarchaea archaeon]|nr:aminotransferase class III-fold pyridoxal phosphate-dependent enzyme [Theionarchaea archaeon]